MPSSAWRTRSKPACWLGAETIAETVGAAASRPASRILLQIRQRVVLIRPGLFGSRKKTVARASSHSTCTLARSGCDRTRSPEGVNLQRPASRFQGCRTVQAIAIARRSAAGSGETAVRHRAGGTALGDPPGGRS